MKVFILMNEGDIVGVVSEKRTAQNWAEDRVEADYRLHPADFYYSTLEECKQIAAENQDEIFYWKEMEMDEIED